MNFSSQIEAHCSVFGSMCDVAIVVNVVSKRSAMRDVERVKVGAIIGRG